MRDRAIWNAAKERARAEAELAGVTDGRVIVRQAWAEYLVLAEIASETPTTPTLSAEKSQKTSDFAPLQISAEQLRIWQEKNRALATEAEMEAAIRLVPEERCGLCDGARFIRDPEFRPGTKKAAPMHARGQVVDSLTGALPCPECNAQHSSEALLARSNIPTSLQGLTFETAEPRPGKEQAIEELREWAKAPKQSLCLHGLYGVGKTHLSIAAVIACCEAGIRAEFWPLQSLLREMQLRFGAADDSAQAFEQSVTSVPVLVLDDVGAEQRSQSGWSTEVFERMLDARLNAKLPTLITTNLTQTALAQHVDARAASRLRLFRFIEIGGVDMRAEIGRRMAEV
jgi:DNA replication protein DnaC